MQEGLVSIITPCYNGEKYVKRILNSVLNQTYGKIQFIFVNDGSTDRTEEIAKEYKEKMEQKGYEYIYIYKENGGQASAINEGLKQVTGQYLTWPDADDELTSDSIQKKVEYLQKHPEFAFVLSEAIVIDEDTNEIIGELKRKENCPSNIFENLVLQKDIWFAPGSYMIRMDKFEEVNPKRQIYESRGGQNWQMLLPLAYQYVCGYLPEKLFKYYVRKNSHSHSTGDYRKEITRIENQEDILKHELEKLQVYDKYRANLEEKYYKEKMNIAYKYGEKLAFLEQYDFFKIKKKLTLKMRIKKIIIKIRK